MLSPRTGLVAALIAAYSGPSLAAATSTNTAVATPTIAAVATPNTLDPALTQKLLATKPSDLVAVIIQHPIRVDLAALRQTGAATRALAHTKVLQALQAQYAATLGPAFEAKLRALGGTRIIPLWASNSVAVTLPASAIAKLKSDPAVGVIKPDAVVRLQAFTYSQLPPSEWNIAAVKAPQVWNLGYNGQNTVVGVLDSGADPKHQDLVGRWRGGTNSWYDPYGQHATPYDASGHGTGVTSLIVGGAADGTGVGVAPGAQWIAARVFNDAGTGLTSSIHQAMQWMLNPDNNAITDDVPEVVNASWNIAGAIGACSLEFEPDVQAFQASDIAIVFAAGNDGPSSSSSDSPGNNPGVTAVGAVDNSKTVGSFSSRGPSACDGSIFPAIVAPGVNIKAADLTYGGVFPNNYANITGTTPATAHVTGAMAVLLGAFPTARASDVQAAIVASALPLGTVGPNNNTGAGQLDVLAAYNLLAKSFTPSAPNPLSSTTLISVAYVTKTSVMTVTATSALNAGAAMKLAGYGAMTYSAKTKQWTISVKTNPEPAVITVTAADGSRAFNTAPGV